MELYKKRFTFIGKLQWAAGTFCRNTCLVFVLYGNRMVGGRTIIGRAEHHKIDINFEF